MTTDETPHEREARVVLFDMKARKGHLCQGGELVDGIPVCGCGVNLVELPDFMGPPPTDDDPPWDASAPAREKLDHNAAPLDHDQLEQKGKEITDAHGSGAVDMRPALPLIDPTRPFGPAEIEARILEANNRLERGSEHEANLVAAAEQLGVEYKLAYARALRDSTGGAADVRKADATLATERLYRQWMDAVAAMKAMQSVTHSLRATLSGYQSVGRSVGVSYNTTSGRGR